MAKGKYGWKAQKVKRLLSRGFIVIFWCRIGIEVRGILPLSSLLFPRRSSHRSHNGITDVSGESLQVDPISTHSLRQNREVFRLSGHPLSVLLAHFDVRSLSLGRLERLLTAFKLEGIRIVRLGRTPTRSKGIACRRSVVAGENPFGLAPLKIIS